MFKRYWVWTDVGDPLTSLGSGIRTIEYDEDTKTARSPIIPELSVHLMVGEFDHIAHIDAHEDQTITDVTRALRAFKPKD
jgi:hypothetical protein